MDGTRFISCSCQRKSYSYEGKPNQSFSSVTCLQEHVARLIARIKAALYFKNTVIVMTSDHLAMNNTAHQYLIKQMTSDHLAMNNTAHQYLIKQRRHDLFMVIRGDRPQAEVSIEYTDPLPARFDVVITARAFGPNAHRPIPVRVGEQ